MISGIGTRWFCLAVMVVIPAACTNDDISDPDDPASGTQSVTELEYLHSLADCLKRAGWEMTVDEAELSVEAVNVTDDQIDSYNEAFQECDARVEQPGFDKLSDDEIRDSFDEYVALKSCLEGLGYEISDPPSIDTFVATYYTDDPWNPYYELPTDMPEDEWLHVNEQCPQVGDE